MHSITARVIPSSRRASPRTSSSPPVTPPVRLVLPGAFWDSQIYAGHLFLFTQDKELRLLDWDRVIGELEVSGELRIVADAAFRGNSRLYGRGAYELLQDPEVRSLVVGKFRRLASVTLEINATDPRWTIQRRDNPFPFPHADSDIHYNIIYTGSSSGIFSVERGQLLARSARMYSEKVTDIPAYDVTARHSILAIAAGSDGLIEVPLERHRRGERSGRSTRPVSSSTCTACEWAYWSLYASSPDGTGFLAAYERVAPDPTQSTSRRHVRKFDREVSSEDLFQAGVAESEDEELDLLSVNMHVGVGDGFGFSWGAEDKIYAYRNGAVEVLRYRPRRSDRREDEIRRLGRIELTGVEGEIVAARVVPFGTIIEFDEMLLVLPSVGEPLVLPGEPVSWRVFPRSENYLNQLHVVYEDRLEIWSFTHDYFANQREKLAGTEVGINEA